MGHIGHAVTEWCDKCGRRLPEPAMSPAYCAKCELVNSLLVERYSAIPKNDQDN